MAEESKEAARKKGGSKSGMIVAIAVVVGLACGGGVAGMLMRGGGGGGAGEKHAGKAVETAPPAVVPFEPFVVNLADPKGDRFLKLTLRLVVNSHEVAESFKGEKADELVKARVRDKIISVLTSKMFSDINSTAGKEALRRELIHDINTVLPEEAVQEVLFVDLAVQ